MSRSILGESKKSLLWKKKKTLVEFQLSILEECFKDKYTSPKQGSHNDDNKPF